MSTPESRLWTACRKHLPAGVAAFRVENRAGVGMPDVAIVLRSGTAWVELKAPKSQPRLRVEETDIRTHLFCFSSDYWESAFHQKLQSQEVIEDVTTDNIMLSFATPAYVRSSQSAWHARVFGVGAVSFFLEKAQASRSLRLFSPYISPDDGSLRLGLVCESEDWAVILYALRLSSEIHGARSLGFGL